MATKKTKTKAEKKPAAKPVAKPAAKRAPKKSAAPTIAPSVVVSGLKRIGAPISAKSLAAHLSLDTKIVSAVLRNARTAGLVTSSGKTQGMTWRLA